MAKFNKSKAQRNENKCTVNIYQMIDNTRIPVYCLRLRSTKPPLYVCKKTKIRIRELMFKFLSLAPAEGSGHAGSYPKTCGAHLTFTLSNQAKKNILNFYQK